MNFKKYICIMLSFFISILLCGCSYANTNTEKSDTDESEQKPDFNSAFPVIETDKSYYNGQYEWQSHPEDFKLVAFTFDDAPSYYTKDNNNSATLINTLKKYEGYGTFFVIGQYLESNGTALMTYALETGFEIANHTYDHKDLTTLSRQDIKDDIEKNTKLIQSLLSVTPKFVRPGFLATNPLVYDVLNELKLPLIGRGNEITDAIQDITSDKIADAIISSAYDGEIILLHSFKDTTAGAIERICSTLYKKGFRFVTLTQLFEYKGIDYDELSHSHKITDIKTAK